MQSQVIDEFVAAFSPHGARRIHFAFEWRPGRLRTLCGQSCVGWDTASLSDVKSCADCKTCQRIFDSAESATTREP